MPGADAPKSSASPTPALERRLGPVTLPSRTVLLGVFVGRLVVAVLAVIVAALGREERPEAAFLLAIAVLLALLLTAYGAWRSVVQLRATSVAMLVAQGLADLGLIAALALNVGADHPATITLLVVVIAAYGLLLPLRPAGILLAAALLAFSLTMAATSPTGLDTTYWGQALVFAGIYAVVGYLGTLLRAAEAEQSALQTQLAQARLEADDILQHIAAGILTVDGRGRLGFINPTAEALLGVEGAEWLGRPVLEMLQARSPALHEAFVVGIERNRRTTRGEGEVRREDGRRLPIGLSTTTFGRPGEERPAVTAIFSDISDLQHIQALHQRAERLEAVAELAASLAHEIRNPLASIRSSVEQLAGSSTADADDRFLGQLIMRESDRLSRLLTEFLDFSRVRAADFSAVDLQALAADAARLVREHPDCSAGVRIEVEAEPAVVDADADLLHRALMNLLLNAVQAVAGSGRPGTVRVAVDVPPADGLRLGREFDRPVRLRVTDTGPGVDPELLPRLFEPFVSGRPGGSGLGLAIVQRAVEAHRGLVFVDAAPGGGTIFTIYLHARAAGREPA